MLNYDENDEFQKFRQDCMTFARIAERTIIKEWLEKINYTEPVGYACNLSAREMTIYTTRPGVLIGKAGSSVRELEAMLTDKFCGIWKVKFVEIRGGFANIDTISLTHDELVDKIASFFEKEENWKQLKTCWLEDDHSGDLRKMLFEALK